MVGVPGRSRGCHSCRKHKVACSLERPECSICLRAGRACSGYGRDTVFVISQAPKDGTGVFRVERYAPSRQPAQGQHTPSGSCDRVGIKKQDSLMSCSDQSAAVSSQAGLNLAAYRQQLFGRFLSRYEPTRPGTASMPVPHWLTKLGSRPTLSPSLEKAAMAVCTAKLGREASSVGMLTESLRLYSDGIGAAQQALSNPQHLVLDDTLGLCLLLATYEAVECPSQSSRGYASHLAGCGRLIELRGPEAHASGFGHSIFESFRYLAVC